MQVREKVRSVWVDSSKSKHLLNTYRAMANKEDELIKLKPSALNLDVSEDEKLEIEKRLTAALPSILSKPDKTPSKGCVKTVKFLQPEKQMDEAEKEVKMLQTYKPTKTEKYLWFVKSLTSIITIDANQYDEGIDIITIYSTIFFQFSR